MPARYVSEPTAVTQEPATAILEVQQARESAAGHDWEGVYLALNRVDQTSGLTAEDLELLATSAFLTGNREESRRARMRAYQIYAQRGESRQAARCALRIGLDRINTSEITRAVGCLPASMSSCTAWVVRASTHLTGEERVAEHGYLLIPQAYEQLALGGDLMSAADSAAQAREIGRQHREPDLVALALVIEGRALARLGSVEEGLTRLHEATAEVASGSVSTPIAGIVLASAVEAAGELLDVERYQEWCDLLAEWCDTQKGMVTFKAREMVHRARLQELHGDWDQALDLAMRAAEQAANEDPLLAGAAVYRQAEVHRLRGEQAAAEEAYATAARFGHDPQPGLALLQVREGAIAAGAASLDRALAESSDPLRRAELLPARIEILIGRDSEAVSQARRELAGIAAKYGSAVLEATAEQTAAALLIEEGDALSALASARNAARVWRHFDIPFEEARARILIARSCDALADHTTASLELEAARSILSRLRARPCLAEVDVVLGQSEASGHGLTRRELEVLRLVAAGLSNRQIAEEIAVAVRTVETHVSSILTKLGLKSRSAATSYAHRHGLA